VKAASPSKLKAEEKGGQSLALCFLSEVYSRYTSTVMFLQQRS
jgi:hypothetical protein